MTVKAEKTTEGGIQRAADAYHETLAEARESSEDAEERLTTFTLSNVKTDEAIEEVYLIGTDGDGGTIYLRVKTASDRELLALADRLGLDDGESLTSVLGEEFSLNIESGTLGEGDDGPLETALVNSTPGSVKINYVSFDRLLALVRVRSGGDEAAHEVELEADGDETEVVLSADLPHYTPTWHFDVPEDPGEVENAPLTEFVGAVGAGGPGQLDRHRVRVAPKVAATRSGDTTTGFVSDRGEYLILPSDWDGFSKSRPVDDYLALAALGLFHVGLFVAGVGGFTADPSLMQFGVLTAIFPPLVAGLLLWLFGRF